MTPEQGDLLRQARDSLAAAKLLHTEGYHGFAASRAYYAMFYVAEACLLGKGLSFSKHSGVHAAFGAHFVKTGLVPPEFHRYLIRGMEVRHIGDYGRAKAVTLEETAEQIIRAEQFLQLAERLIGPIPAVDTK
jgi:uncharacterized protein (UPF0332 family)